MELTIQNLSVEYQTLRTKNTLLALKDISIAVASGSFTVILGPSGCGKTSLLNTIAGLQTASVGEIRIDGQRVAGPGRNRAMVFQAPSLLPWRSVLKNVTYGLELQGVRGKQADTTAMKYIKMIGLEDFLESYPRELSGGMKQRVNLARALATSPAILLMDEPLAGLDPQLREMLQVELQHVWMETGTTTLFVTHLIDEAIFLADQIIVLSARPGSIKKILNVNLPRPRTLEIKKDLKFHHLEATIWDLLEEEFIKMPQETGEVKPG